MYQHHELKGRISNLKCHNQGSNREYWSYDIYINHILFWHEDYAVGTREQVIEAAIKLGNAEKERIRKKIEEINQQKELAQVFRKLTTEEYARIAERFDLPEYTKTAIIRGMLHYYGFDGYDPFYCQLPVCENGDRIEVGGKYQIPIYGVCKVVMITRSTIFHYFTAIDEDGEAVHDLKIGEFIKRV
jgi:hypothetical protein